MRAHASVREPEGAGIMIESDRRRFLRSLAAAALVGPSMRSDSAAAPSASAVRWTAVQALIDRHVGAGKVAGAIAGLSLGGRASTAYLSGGTLAFDSLVRIGADSIWRIYSMSKPVTGIATLALIEDGALELDQPVAEVLPALGSLRVAIDINKGLDARPATRVMTIRHLLTHTSGFSYWTPNTAAGLLPTAYRDRGITPGNFGVGLKRPGYGPQANGLREMIARLAELPLAFEPGTAYLYSLGLDVMGAVIERVTGQTLDRFLRDRIFLPLDMVSTGFQVAARDTGRLTTNYWMTPDGIRTYDAAATSAFLQPPTLLSGGGGLVSTARDFARFGQMLLAEGTLGTVRILKAATVRRALSNLLPPGVVYPEGGGLGAGGWVALPGYGKFRPPGSFGWGGAAGTVWWIVPTTQMSVFFMTQHMPPHPFPVYDELRTAVEADLAASVPRHP
jgi:CubicO group peptidase (beta-lactamase class C family)